MADLNQENGPSKTIQSLWAKSDERTQEIINNPLTFKNIIPYLLMIIAEGIPRRGSTKP